MHDEFDNAAFHEELSRRDPLIAAYIPPSDQKRMARAWEVIEATGVSMAEWGRRHADTHPPGRFTRIVVSTPRETPHARCDDRFEEMVTNEAVDEVWSLLARAVSPSHPVMKTVGVRELERHLDGETSFDETVARGSARRAATPSAR